MPRYECICYQHRDIDQRGHSQACQHYNWGTKPPKASSRTSTVTYYKVWKYLIDHGLTKGQAHYVRNMIRELKGL